MTVSEEDYHTIRETLIESAGDDYVGLWQVPWWIERLVPGAEQEEVRGVSLRLIRDLLDHGVLRAGQLSESGKEFLAWKLSPQEVVDLVEAQWPQTGKPPNIGEVLWFDATEGPERAASAQPATVKE